MKKVVVLIGLLVCAIVTLPVMAGGWAVVTLDALPTDVVAEESFTIGFTVRQHGQQLTGGLTPQITAVHAETGESITVPAEAEGIDGHYAAVMTLPNAGTWSWHINAFGYDQPMPAMIVQPASVVPSGNSGRLPVPLLSLLSWVATAGLLLVGWRSRSRLVLGLGLVTAVIGAAAYVLPITPPAETAVAQNVSASPSLVEQGEALFVAKGCVMCHQNERSITLSAPHIGPNLTDYKADPEFVRSWLADPLAMKPEALMPDLQLGDEEIEALTAFLTVETVVTP